jgi:hypothetical protein
MPEPTAIRPAAVYDPRTHNADGSRVIKCVFDQTVMCEIPGGLPEWMNPQKVVDYLKTEHPSLWRFGGRFYTGTGVKKGVETVKENLRTFKCPKCGWIATFDKGAEKK